MALIEVQGSHGQRRDTAQLPTNRRGAPPHHPGHLTTRVPGLHTAEKSQSTRPGQAGHTSLPWQLRSTPVLHLKCDLATSPFEIEKGVKNEERPE